MDIAAGRFDALRAACQTAGIKTAGVIDDHSVSVQSWMDRIAKGAGIAWGDAVDGMGLLWPQAPADPVAQITAQQAPSLNAETSARDLCTRVTIEYAYDPSLSDYRQSLTLRAPAAVERFGDIHQRIDAGWLQDTASAYAYAERYLHYYGRPLWRLQITGPITDLAPGQSLSIDHPYAPVSLATVTERTRGMIDDNWTLQAPIGDAPEVELEHHAGAVAVDAQAEPVYSYLGHALTLYLTDESGQALANAIATLDGAQERRAGLNGAVQWQGVAAGKHLIDVESAGRDPQQIEVYL
jgi:hypothetical protein